MKEGPDIARLGALIGDPARANMLTALMSGKALTPSELAAVAGVTLATTSAHLSKLEAGGLIAQRKQGRHRYFSLADDDVGTICRDHCFENNLIMRAVGKSMILSPPLIISKSEIDELLEKADMCFKLTARDIGIA